MIAIDPFHVNLLAHPFGCTWEQVATALESLPQMLLEPDGSFVVSGLVNADRWQIDGHLFDFDGRLHRVELRGHCPRETFDRLLTCVGWPKTELLFEMVREGVTLTEVEFRGTVDAAEVEDDTARLAVVEDNTARLAEVEDNAARSARLASRGVPAPGYTTWHITFGTYGTRLHGDTRPTVDKQHNQLGESFLVPNPKRRQAAHKRMKHSAILFSSSQRSFIEQQLPEVCKRGGWQFRVAAAAEDHVHLLCDIRTEIHGEKVRRLVKRWLTQSLNRHWTLPEGGRWWATEGSNKAIHDDAYRENAFHYIERQRTLR